jgi:uncharacterized protein (TIGR01777 family)
MSKKIIIAGGSGLVGTRLTELLIEKGYEVSWFSRNPLENGTVKQYELNYETGTIDSTPLETADVLINLAGAPINGKRWSKKYKKLILESRTKTTSLLLEAIAKSSGKVKTYVQASAVGYYGYADSEKVFAEKDPPGNDFLANVCQKWENAGLQFPELPIRRVFVRIGVVFSPGSQAFEKMALPVKYNIGAPLGSGKQFFPWIHLDDLSTLFATAIENNSFSGAYNAVAPQHLTNQEVTQIMARHYGKKLWLPNVPSFVLKLAFGEMAQLLLKGNKVSALKVIGEGVEFKYPKLEEFMAKVIRFEDEGMRG